jgi:hypothetical protein
MFMYEFISRDPALELHYMMHEHDEKEFKDPAKWVKDRDVELDADVAEFYFELMAWIRKRRAGKKLAHYTEAPEHIDWPNLPERVRTMGYFYCERRRTGTPYLEWTRPATSKLDPTRRLLATGRCADEDEEARQAVVVNAEITRATTVASGDGFAAESVGTNNDDKRKSRASGKHGSHIATLDSAGKTASGRVRRKLPGRQAKLAKWKQASGAVGAMWRLKRRQREEARGAQPMRCRRGLKDE